VRGGILQQNYPSIELIVLDDHSTDSTPVILDELARPCAEREVRFRVIHGAELPPGWAGKPHALHQAARAAHGDWLCFIDADTFLSPEAVSSVYAKTVETSADLFTTANQPCDRQRQVYVIPARRLRGDRRA
jgi:chlorobactene glucosyltransferase